MTLNCQRIAILKLIETFKSYLGFEGGRLPQPWEDNQMEAL